MRTRDRLLVSLVLLLASVAGADDLALTGTVVGPDGTPVGGAEVVTLSWNQQRHEELRALTDANGVFHLTVGQSPSAGRSPRVNVLVRKPGLAMAMTRLQPAKPVTVKLGDDPEIRCGVLLGAEGKPIPDVRVEILQVSQTVPVEGEPPYYLSGILRDATIRTDAAGRFSLADFAPGMAVEVSVAPDGYAAGGAWIATTAAVTIALPPEATVAGTVRVKGQPQGGLSISAQSSGSQHWPGAAVTAADGTYLLHHLPPGQASIYVSPPEELARPTSVVRVLASGAATTGVDFDLSPGGLIRGRVTDAKTGQPAAGAYVSAIAAGRQGGGTRADAEGRYQLRLTPGEYVLRAQPPAQNFTSGRPQVPDLAPAIVKEGAVLEGQDLAVKLPRTVTAQALLPDGQPAPGARLRLLAFGYAESVEGKVQFAVPEGLAAYWPAERPLVLLATDPAQNLAGLASYPLDALPDVIEVQLAAAASVRVQVNDLQGRPVEGLQVATCYPQGDRGSISFSAVASDAQGALVITCLPPGVKLSFSPTGPLAGRVKSTEWAQASVVLTPGEERKLPPIIVDPAGRSLNVFVGDAEGLPIPGAAVYVSDLRGAVLTDQQGKALLTGLNLQGKVLVYAADPALQRCAAVVVDPDVGPWPGLLLRPPGTVTGTLLDRASGKPLAGMQVSCQLSAPEYWRLGEEIKRQVGLSPTTTASTGPDGRWRLDGLVSGLTYQLIAAPATADGRARRSTYVGRFEAAGGPEEQDLGPMQCTVVADE